MNVRYRVELSQAERGELTALLSGGKHAARKLKRAQILLAADAGASDEEIATSIGVGGSTVYRTKRRFVSATWRRRSGKSRGRARAVSSRAKRKRFWSRPLVRARPRAARAGRLSFWRVNWSASPPTQASRGKLCAGAWPKTT